MAGRHKCVDPAGQSAKPGMSVGPLAAEVLSLGEGARWVDGRLVLVDIVAGRLLEHSGVEGESFRTLATLDVPLGAVAPIAHEPGHWIAAAGTGVVLLDPDGRLTWLAQPEGRADGATRMNDGVADPAGRFWAGSMAYDGSTPLGSLYRVDHDGSVHRVWEGLAVTNGPAFTRDGAHLFLADTARRSILRFPVSPGGDLGEPEVRWRAAAAEGSPDGMTVADDGTLWVALWGGSEIRGIAPDGGSDVRIPVPASQPTSVCIAEGRLVVTSAVVGLSEASPEDGRVHIVRGPAVSGAPACSYRRG